jgi:hypothetical protein
MSIDEYETFEVVSYEDVHDVFPWFSLSYHDLLDKLELIYAADEDISKIPYFAYSVVQSLRKMQKNKPGLIEKIYNNSLVLPIIKESLVINDSFENNKNIKKATESHRPLISAFDAEGYRIYNDAYIPDYSTNNTISFITGEIVKDTICDLDITNIIEKNADLDFRGVPKETQIALVAIYLNLGKLGSLKHYNHNGSQSTSDKVANDIIRVSKYLFASKIYQINNRIKLYEAEFILDYIERLSTNYEENYILQLLNKPAREIDRVIFPRDRIYVRIANFLKPYYKFLVPNANGYTPAFFSYEIMRELDFGGFGNIFALVMSDYAELDDKEFTKIAHTAISYATNVSNDTGSINKSLLDILKSRYKHYNEIITNQIIETKKQNTLNDRNFKDQIYRSLILSIYGVKRYNQLVQKSKQIKNPVFFEIVSAKETVEIENTYREIVEYRKKVQNTKCKHITLRKDYDLLPLNERKKHLILLDLVESFSSYQRTNQEQNNHQIICKNDNLIIACEHEVLLAKWVLAKNEDKMKIYEQLNEKYIINDYNYDEGICKFCGRRIEETKTLIMATEFDSFHQPVKKLRLTLNDTREIEDAVIRAISRSEPMRGVDEIVQRMMAIFTWEDVRRITDNVEFSIMDYYTLIEQRRDSLERIYKNLAKVCVIYSHLIYEAMTFRPESESYFITPDHPWVDNGTNRTWENYIKRALFMIRLRFWNVAGDANKIGPTILRDYMISMYKRYIAEKNKFKMAIISSVDRWSNLYYKMSITEIISVHMKIISKFSNPANSDAEEAKMYAIRFMEQMTEIIPKNKQEFINYTFAKKKELDEYNETANLRPRKIANKLCGQTFSKVYTEPAVYLLEDYSAQVQVISPVDYNEYGIPQKWEKIIIYYKNSDGAKELNITFDNDNYKQITDLYNLFYKNLYNAENILPDNFILANDPRVTSIDYINISGDKKSELKKKTYTEAEQVQIRTKIEEQKIIASMYEYASNTQNKSFMKTLKDSVSYEKSKGHVTSNYKKLLDEFTYQLSLDRMQKGDLPTKNKKAESTIELPIHRDISNTAVQFRNVALTFVDILIKNCEINNKLIADEYYKGILSLGRKTIQEKEELDGYWGLSDKLKELTQEEIITVHTQYQIDRIKNYIRSIYTAGNNLFYYDENENVLYNTVQGRMVMKYAGKFTIPITEIQKIVNKKISKKISRDAELEIVFNRFIELCTLFLRISKTASLMIKEFIDLFLDQDISMNLDRRYRDYQNEYREAMFQFKYDKEVLRRKLQINDIEFSDELKEEQDPGDDAIFHEKQKNNGNNKRELYAASREYGQDYHRLTEKITEVL